MGAANHGFLRAGQWWSGGEETRACFWGHVQFSGRFSGLSQRQFFGEGLFKREAG